MQEDAPNSYYFLLDHEKKRSSSDANYKPMPLNADIRSTPGRWFVLFSFAWLSCNQSIVWFTFSSVPDNAKGYYPFLSDAKIDLLLNWGNILIVPLILVVMWWQSRNARGLRAAFCLGAGLTLAGSIVRSMPCWFGSDFHTREGPTLAFLHIGQILNAITGPISMGLPSRLSAIWFPDEQRVTATAIASIASSFGMICFIIGPAIANVSENIPRLLYVEIGTSLVPVLCALIYFPEQPEDPPSATAAALRVGLSNATTGLPEGEMSFWQSLRTCLTDRTMLLIVAGGGILQGCAQSWQGVLPQIMSEVSISNSYAGNLGFANAMAGTVGGLLCGVVTDRYFHRRYLLFTRVALAFTIVMCMWWEFTMPTPFSGTLLPRNDGTLFTATSLQGFAFGLTYPIFYEMAAEQAFPVVESTTGGLYIFFTSSVGTIFLFAAPDIGGNWDNFLTLLGAIACLIMLSFADLKYNRADAEISLRSSNVAGLADVELNRSKPLNETFNADV